MGHGTVTALGKASIRMPIGPDLFLKFDVDVVDHDIPPMFGLEHHRELKCSSNEFKNTFTHHPSGKTIPVTFREETKGSGGHLFIQGQLTKVLLTEVELQKLHTQFGHPYTDALVNLLKKAKPGEMHPSVRKTVEEIAKRCTSCQIWAPLAARFRVSLPTENLVFNHEIEVDVMSDRRRSCSTYN